MMSMLRHYLHLALRTLASHRLYSFINVLGLSVALTCAIFVVLFVRYQLSYDKWIPDTQNLYRVESVVRFAGKTPLRVAATSYPLGLAMRAQIPGVTGMTRLSAKTLTLTHGERQFLEKNVDFVDSSFFRLIRLPFIEGDPRSALSQPESVVLTQSAARRYFGTADPMGRTLTANAGSCPSHRAACPGDTVALRVTGIVRDLPQNTQLTGKVFIPMRSLANPDSPSQRKLWFMLHPYTYITLAPGVTPASVLAEMPRIFDQDLVGVVRKMGIPLRGSQAYAIHLTPFAQVHLSSSRWQANLTPPGSWTTVYGVIIIGVLILLVACFNFTNLATARAALRAREIGLRKTLGAARRQLAIQFLSEALFLALISLVCAAAAAQILLPAFNGFLHQSIALSYATDWRLDLIVIGIATGAGLVSGVYPALVLSRLRPVAALHSKTGGSQMAVGLRDVLVLMQFAVSIGLGIAALVVFRQVDYARNLNLGFHRNDIVVIRNSTLTGERQEAFARALRANPSISHVGLSLSAPFGHTKLAAGVQVPGQPAQLTLNWLPIGPGYPRTYGIALVAGRLLTATHGADRFTRQSMKSTVNVLVNVAAARMMGLQPEAAVGRTITMNGAQTRIVGVLGDARVYGARARVPPTIYGYVPSQPMNVSVRLRADHIVQTLGFIDRTWHAFAPTVAIQRSFLNARFAQLYRSDGRDGSVFGVFVIVAIFIACLGLYGLVVFTAERRTKEVAVRKISGARTLDILKIMLWRISVPVVLGNVIAWPVAYYYLHRWLEGFADHIWLDPSYFVAGGASALVIAWATVFVHTLRLAHTSPVHALRYE